VRRVLLSTFATVIGLVLLLSLKPHQVARMAALPQSSEPSAGSTSGTPSTRSTPGTQGTKKSTSLNKRTVTGSTVDTPYGPVQVQVSLAGHKITSITALQIPSDDGRSQRITEFAVPRLTHEALTAQNAQIDAVSGASYTSQGYIQSLQSALDKAGA
jgi:uncharacterized protein with FMN-binding domain